ncbi:MAG: UPF0175 family protein [Chitinivibrionales bacterium]|nr:UPF0175 family protein [Chitinivibrionales bacterium]
MHAITLELPGFIDADKDEMKLYLAAALFREGKLSLGQAAETAGLSKRTFIELLGKHGYEVIQHNPDDLEQDMANA